MKQLTLYFLLTTLTATLVPAQTAAMAQTQTTLWDRQPASIWTEPLPIGNGDLGAMIYGGAGGHPLPLNNPPFCTTHPHRYYPAHTPRPTNLSWQKGTGENPNTHP